MRHCRKRYTERHLSRPLYLHALDDDYDLVWVQGGLVRSVNLCDQKPLQFQEQRFEEARVYQHLSRDL